MEELNIHTHTGMLITVDQSDFKSRFKEWSCYSASVLIARLCSLSHNYPIVHAAWGTAVEGEWNKRQRRRRRSSREMKIEMKDPRISFKLIRIHVEEHAA